MRKAGWWILMMLVAGLGLCWLTGQRQHADNAKCGAGQAAAVIPAAQRVATQADVAAAAGVGVPAPGKRTAFRVVLDGDTVRLLETEELQGDFHRRRGRLAWVPGMLYCRLLDSRQQVVAEETFAAPDQACVVVTPHVAATDGNPSAVSVAATAPVVFQVRMPSVASAAQLQVYRVTGARPADTSAEAAAKLLGNLVLPR